MALQSANMQTRFTILLAPFQSMIRIELEAYLNTTVECYLEIKNPSDQILIVTVTKVPDAKRQITLSTDRLEILGHCGSTILIEWSPKEAGCWRDILQLTDSRRIKYDIAISTTAKATKKRGHMKPLREATLPKLSHFSGPMLSDVTNANKRVKRDEPKSENSSNKENLPGQEYRGTKICTSQEDKSTRPHHHGYHEPTYILSEYNANVWNDGSVLPQISLTPSTPQEIRRATYVKERRHYNGNATTCERSEEVTENVTCAESKSNFSILINQMKFKATKTITISTRPTPRKESTVFTSSKVEGVREEGDKTFAVDSPAFEVSAISAPGSNSVILSPLPRPLECCESSFRDDVNSLIASSPISQRSRNDVPRLERSGCFADGADCSGRVDREYFSCTTIPEDVESAEKTGDVYIEISPPKKYSKSYAPLFSTKTGKVAKEKNLCSGRSAMGHHQLFVPVAPAKKSARKNHSAIKINKSALCTLREMKKCTVSTARDARTRVEEISIYELFIPSPFAPSMTENPFLKNNASVFSEKWLSRQELVFTLWLNSVLSTPKDLRVNVDNAITDTVGRWQSRKGHDNGVDVSASSSTQESTSTSCHTAKKLQAVRQGAYAMLRRPEVAEVKSRIDRCVTEGMLYIRSDRNLHRDVSLQKDVLNVFLCYNPLWLRVGLEAVYNENIPLRGNNDLPGLARFLTERFFANPQLTKIPGYHRADPGKKFLKALNQFILKKFLLLVYFLDYAKQRRLISHDPCLFRKQAAWRTSREILLRFSRDLLAGVGDVTKILRGYDYVLTHQQTYIDEYEYEVADIRQDLRDGVRLCRLVELIAGLDGLTRRCRAPAISLLQKVHNAEVALGALRRTGGVLAGDVTAKDIAHGDRMKTLSLLWQIVHRIEEPRLDRAARAIQRWWRSRVRQVRAATVIQRAWRLRNSSSRRTGGMLAEERANFLRARRAATRLQRWWRRARESAPVRGRRVLEAERRRAAVAVLQTRWRATLLMRAHRERYRALRRAALTVQTARRRTKLRRAELLRAREAAATRIQAWWRSGRLARQTREVRKRDACLRIQTWWRAASCSRRYQLLRSSCVKLQRWWRERRRRLARRRAASLIGSWYLCVRTGRAARDDYSRMRRAAARLQTWWRAVSLARQQRARYSGLRRSAVVLQTLWRRRALARRQREQFLAIRTACVTLQSFWRMVRVRRWCERRGSRAIVLQRRWRAILAGRRARREYADTRACVIALQRRWRAVLVGRRTRREYEDIRARVILVQSRWRASVARARFLRCRQAAIVIQSYYRMRLAARLYNDARRAALTIQVYWRRHKRRRIEAEALEQREDLALIAERIQNECGDSQAGGKAAGSCSLPDSDFWRQTIDELRTCNNIGTLLTYLNSLDTITKLSPTTRVILCQLNLIDEIYNTISQRNRSQPWMIVCQRACTILITLAKYPRTKKYVAQKEHALLLVKLLSDALKDKEVFLHCATLIWLLIQDEDYLKAMTTRFDTSWLLRNIQQNVLKATAVAKLHKSKKLEKLYFNCESDQGTALQFTNMNAAISAIVNRTNII